MTIRSAAASAAAAWVVSTAMHFMPPRRAPSHAGRGIFHHDAVGGSAAQAPGGLKINRRVGFAGQVGGRNQTAEKWADVETVHQDLDIFLGGRGSHGLTETPGLEAPQPIQDAGQQLHVARDMLAKPDFFFTGDLCQFVLGGRPAEDIREDRAVVLAKSAGEDWGK